MHESAQTPHPQSAARPSWMAWVLVGLAVTVPLFVSQTFDNPYREAKFSLIWFVVSLGALTLASRPISALPPLLKRWLVAYGAAMLISMIGVIHAGRALEYGFEQLAMLALIPMGGAWLSTHAGRQMLVWAIVGTTALVALIALAQDTGLITWGVDRRWPYPSSTLGFKNLAGQIYLLGGVASWACVLHPEPSRRLKALAGATFILAVWGIWSVRARSCGLGLGLGMTAVVALHIHQTIRIVPSRGWQAALIGALSTTLLISSLMSGGPGMKQTREKRAPTDASTLDTRMIRWSNSIDVWLDHPVTGVGLGNFRVHYPKYGQTDPQQNERMNVHEAHNEFLQVLVECGVMGLLCWLGLLTVILRELWRTLMNTSTQQDQLVSIIAAAALLAILGHTFFSFALRNPAPPVWCWLLVGAALGTPLASARKSQTTLLSIAWFVFGISTMTWALWTAHTSHLTRRGVHAMAQRDIETTTTSLEAAAQHPNADRALLKLCYAYGKANQRQLAARTCLRALERQPFNPIIHDQLARQYHAAGNLNQALIHYERTLDLQPKFERARIERDKVRQFLDQTRDTKNR